jgi:hypothetical protein
MHYLNPVPLQAVYELFFYAGKALDRLWMPFRFPNQLSKKTRRPGIGKEGFLYQTILSTTGSEGAWNRTIESDPSGDNDP